MPAGLPRSAVDAALRALARRDHTRQEMATRLAGQGFAQAEIEEALARLDDWGYLDDRAVATRAVEECLAGRARGRRLLGAELRARGVPEAAIQEALAAYAPESEENLARAVLLRKGMRLPLPEGDRARAWRILARLGFSEATLERLCGLPNP